MLNNKQNLLQRRWKKRKVRKVTKWNMPQIHIIDLLSGTLHLAEVILLTPVMHLLIVSMVCPSTKILASLVIKIIRSLKVMLHDEVLLIWDTPLLILLDLDLSWDASLLDLLCSDDVEGCVEVWEIILSRFCRRTIKSKIMSSNARCRGGSWGASHINRLERRVVGGHWSNS